MKRREFLRSSGALTGALAPAVVPFARWRDAVSGSAPPGPRRASKAPAKLADINATDLRDAIRLGLNPIVRTFDADDIPYLLAVAKPSPRFGFHRLFSEGCVPGIKIEAVLHAERALGT